MRRAQSGFGLLELMLALGIGLILLAAVSQVFTSAHQAWRLQSTAVRMNDEARQALLRMAQDVRMAGMFGCMRLKPGDFLDLAAQPAFARPLQADTSSLSLVVAELPGYAGDPEWTVVTNCTNEVRVHKHRVQGNEKLMAVPVSRHHYVHSGTTLSFKRGDINQPLVDHVRELRVGYVPGERVDLQLTLYEPTLQLEQHHALSVAIRNPVPAS